MANKSALRLSTSGNYTRLQETSPLLDKTFGKKHETNVASEITLSAVVPENTDKPKTPAAEQKTRLELVQQAGKIALDSFSRALTQEDRNKARKDRGGAIEFNVRTCGATKLEHDFRLARREGKRAKAIGLKTAEVATGTGAALVTLTVVGLIALQFAGKRRGYKSQSKVITDDSVRRRMVQTGIAEFCNSVWRADCASRTKIERTEEVAVITRDGKLGTKLKKVSGPTSTTVGLEELETIAAYAKKIRNEMADEIRATDNNKVRKSANVAYQFERLQGVIRDLDKRIAKMRSEAQRV